ncbi:MAG: hypothetical protein EBS55_08350 [Flavobacteriaceae bacterium]|nr:hypothetical protein [Flavobacteriaceae bacterium]
MYFGKPIENAIIQYQQSTSELERNKLLKDIILPALNKLAENIIHKLKFYRYGNYSYSDMKDMCVSHLFDRLHKYDGTKGYKAFSYFDKITRNWVRATMRQIENEYGKGEVAGRPAQNITVVPIELYNPDISRDVINEFSNAEYLEDLRDFCAKWAIWGIRNTDILFKTKKERNVADAIFNLFKNSDSIDIYNKKALYILIREQYNVKTQVITDVLKKLKPLQQQMLQDFLKTGTRNWSKYAQKAEQIE